MRKKAGIQPLNIFSMSINGFFGEYYKAEGEEFKDRCIIALLGSSNGFLSSRLVAERFIKEGINVLILAYHDEPGLPKNRKDIPVDIVARAAGWLNDQGYEKVGIWGYAVGGTLALLSGSLFPELISTVVAIAPMEMVMQADELGKPLDGSTFSYQGKPLPYAHYPLKGRAFRKRYVRELLRHKEPYVRELLLDAYIANDNPEAIIRIWQINGPLLILGGANDSLVPVKETIRSMALRLADHDFPHFRESHIYPHLGHLVLPFRPSDCRRYLSERKYPAECDAEREQSWKDMLTFLRAYWK